MKIVLASNNPGKIAEIRELFSDEAIELVNAASLGIPDVEETGLTFIENAIIKARHASECAKLPALADDSGLEVDALNGAPGVFSARYAGPNATDTDRINKVLTNMEQIPTEARTARYHCVMAFLRFAEDPAPVICHGIWEGLILDTPRGERGFGYDPIFFVPEKNMSAAELDPSEKNRMSHRGKAIKKLQRVFCQ